MLEKLNPLQREAASMLADGKTPQQVKDELALGLSEFMLWRQEPLFVAEVRGMKAERALAASKKTDTDAETAETDALEGALKEQFA